MALAALSHHACCARHAAFQELACRVQVLGGDPIDKRVVRAIVVRAHDGVMQGDRGQAIQIHHSGNQRFGNEGSKSKRLCSVKAEAPDMHSCGGLPPRGGVVDVR